MPNTHATLRALFSDIADAIRAKTGETGTIIADQFPEAIASISGGGGGTEMEDAFVTRTLSGTYENSRVTKVGDFAFYHNTLITGVSFPAAVTVGISAFAYCSKLQRADFPEATAIYSSAFSNCLSLASVNFPKVKTIYSYAFYGAGKANAAYSFPAATTIGDQAFSAFKGRKLDFPKATVVQTGAFYGAGSLKTIIFRAKATFNSSAFTRCYRLASLYLLSKALCVLSNSNAFASTFFDGYSTYVSSGKFLIPSTWLTSYQNATNWVYFSSFFSGLTDAQIAAL